MIRNVQALRAVAALLVVITHLDAMLMLAGYPHGVLAFGTAGVDLFFVVSGFVMVHATSRRTTGPVTFFKDRLIRIVPLYWLLTIVLFGASLYAPTVFAATSSSVQDLIKSLLFIPYLKNNGEIHPVLFLGWTLNYEMFFYAIFALTLLARTLIVRTCILSVAIVALYVAGTSIGKDQAVAFFYTRPIMLEFVVGAWIGLAYVRGVRLPGVLAATCLVLGVMVLLGRFALWPEGERAWWSGTSATAILLGLLSLGDNKSRILQQLGDASYSLYLLHPFVVIAVTKIASRLHLLETNFGLICSGAVAVGLACVSAVVAHRWIEKPMTIWLKGRLAQTQPPKEADGALLRGL